MRKWKNNIIGYLIILIISFSFAPKLVSADLIPEKPIDTTVVDETKLLSTETIATIDQLNRSWAATEQRLQVGVYMKEQLSSDIESLANETFRRWQIGFSGTNNGILLVIAITDRAFRIETSDNAATVLPDIVAKKILDNAREFFRQKDYNGGVSYIVQSIGDRFYGTSDAKNQLAALEKHNSSEDDGFSIFLVVIFVAIILLVIDKSGRGGGGTGSLLWMLVNDHQHYRNNHSSSSSSSDFGGGGWSGGGGGGGGASSGW
ncbi:TPM domain-containing protein [Streptococcus ruminantium]|uniref:TPM domain-containing protein n=1 Tax=Streptococcus ruminantium TaxID=1917441 RepID=UPI0012DCFD74|nr:TPM domain-containing protein [Streptococcus ruminantium]